MATRDENDAEIRKSTAHNAARPVAGRRRYARGYGATKAGGAARTGAVRTQTRRNAERNASPSRRGGAGRVPGRGWDRWCACRRDIWLTRASSTTPTHYLAVASRHFCGPPTQFNVLVDSPG